MTWKKQLIPLNEVETLSKKLLLSIKNGDKRIEKIRCVYKAEDSNVFVMLMPYDFLDLNPKPNIKEFYLYQVLDT
jgi:hypothetical protein